MWTTENRSRYDRSKLRYPSDLTDEEWQLVRTVNPARQVWWRQTHGCDARDRQWAHVHFEHRLPMGRASETSSAQEHGVRLFRSLELGPHARPHPCSALRRVSRTGLARGQSDCRHHRQPERQKRWIVERTLAWLGRCRRLARDWENFNQKALAFLRLASIRRMLRKLCNPV